MSPQPLYCASPHPTHGNFSLVGPRGAFNRDAVTEIHSLTAVQEALGCYLSFLLFLVAVYFSFYSLINSWEPPLCYVLRVNKCRLCPQRLPLLLPEKVNGCLVCPGLGCVWEVGRGGVTGPKSRCLMLWKAENSKHQCLAWGKAYWWRRSQKRRWEA